MAKSTNKLTVKGKGWKQLKDLAAQLEGKPFAKVGVLGRNDNRSGDELGNVELAIVHEFGLGVPKRSFLRAAHDRMAKQWAALMEKQLVPLLVRGKLDVKKALDILGVRASADVKGFIQNGTYLTPLAPSTIAAKGSSAPLIDSARLLNSIDHQSVPGGEK